MATEKPPAQNADEQAADQPFSSLVRVWNQKEDPIPLPSHLSPESSLELSGEAATEEAEASEILARVTLELTPLEERVQRLMFHYGLWGVAFNPLGWLNALRAVDRLLQLETKLTAIIEAQAKEIDALKDRVTKLEAREEILIAEAKGAAAAAASAVASQHVAAIARQVGALEERTRQPGRLPPPE